MFYTLAKSLLISLGLVVAASATDVAKQKKIFKSEDPRTYNWGTAILIISNEEISDIKIVRFLEDTALLVNGATKTVENEAKEQRWLFLPFLYGGLAPSAIVAALSEVTGGKGVIRADKGALRAYEHFWCHFFL